MVAQVSTDTFTRASLIPRPDPSDSDDVLLALETARALEAQGETSEAARWLRRAAEQAENEGRDERIVTLARAAADLANSIAPPSPSTAPARKPEPPCRAAPPPAASAQRVSSPPAVPARLPSPRPMSAAPSRPPTPSRGSTASGTSPRPAMQPRATAGGRLPTPAPSLSAIASRDRIPRSRPAAQPPKIESHIVDKRDAEHTMQIATIRVAIPASGRDANVFVVRRLEAGQPLPAGTIEAMIVLTGTG